MKSTLNYKILFIIDYKLNIPIEKINTVSALKYPFA